MDLSEKTGPYDSPVFRIAGDRGFIIELGQGIDPKVNIRVRAMARFLEKESPEGVREIIPTYRSILVNHDPVKIRPEQLRALVKGFDPGRSPVDEGSRKIVEIPVCYGGDLGPDMENVRFSSGLSEDEVIRLHTGTEYLIYMVGFTPGFPFLGGLDKKLATPRLKTPRMSVPRGSVGIANNQTGIYPIASPGGWQIIGRTPLRLFAPERKNPFLYRAGDWIKFVPVSRQAFDHLEKAEENS
ncbi:5-oxoprolinase subunit PxpB [Desulfospira joergensenii]|uniref:5-oxoprolinase subunit PxpB n=1 Tax=Desulfospira joergensenii TaxID=53329 RepID=UPI0013788F8B|nr:5-oxoprolinase subunit PxpB [Desulfospira joergensenii]